MEIITWFQHLPEYIAWTVALVGGLGTLFVLIRKGRAKAKVLSDRASAVGDVLLGRPAIVHPETGEILLPAADGIGTRMANIESWQQQVGPILVTIAETQKEMIVNAKRIDVLDAKFAVHIEAHRGGDFRGEKGATGADGRQGEAGETGQNGQNGQNGLGITADVPPVTRG